MTILETIQKRRSVRTFDPSPLKEEDAQNILQFASRVENPFDLPIRWKLLDAKKHSLSSPVIVGTDLYIAGKLPVAPHAEEAFGYTFEKVVLFAESLGVGTTWIAGTMNRSAFEKAMEVGKEEIMPCVSPLGYPSSKMTLRETVMRKSIRADSRLPFEELFFSGSFDRPLKKEEAGDLAPALEAVRLGPSAVNRQPWRIVVGEDRRVHFFEKQNSGMADRGFDVQKIDLGIALCHFEMVAAESSLSPAFILDPPALPVGENMHYIASFALK